MQLVDPTAHNQTRRYQRAPALTDLAGLKIGLLSNGKLNADNLLNATAQHFVDNFNARVTKLVYKPNASAPAPTELINGLSEEADYLLTATGD